MRAGENPSEVVPSPEPGWYVRYRVAGFEGTREAGPYALRQAQVELFDIRGYEGVTDACLVEVPATRSAE